MGSKILVIGGGFAGFWAAVAARRVASEADVTLVSPGPMLEIRPRLYEANPETLAVDMRPYLRKADIGFVQEAATGLDTAAKMVTLASGARLAYDRLVVATGSRMKRPSVPGADAAFSVDTQAEAVAFDRRLAAIARDGAVPTIAVIGAGFTGIELVLELRDRLKAHGAGDAAERARIVLIDRADVIGAELGPGPRPAIEAALTGAQVELRLGADVRGIAADRIGFGDDSVLEADAVVLATGMAAASFAAAIPGTHDRLGRVMVDASLKAPEALDIFVAGDAASADTGDGHRSLQSCQHAGQMGRVAGENAARDLLGQPVVAYTQLRYVTCLDLGRSGAVITQGWERQIDKTGSEGKAVKRLINTKVIYPPEDDSLDALLAASSIDLAARTRPIEAGPIDAGPIDSAKEKAA